MNILKSALAFFLFFIISFLNHPEIAYSQNHNQDSPSITCMSYNIHWGVGMDNMYDLSRISTDIQKSKADVIGLQEVDVNFDSRSHHDNQIQILAHQLHMYYFFAPIYNMEPKKYGDPPRQHGVAVLSKYPIKNAVNHQITRLSTIEPNPTPQKKPGFAEVRLQIDGIPVSVYVTHLDYRGDPIIRKKQIKDMLGIIGTCKNVTILLGDLNATPEAEELKPLFNRFHNTLESCMGLCKSFSADKPYALIDYVLTCPEVPVKSVAIPETSGSDHRPVISTIVLPMSLRNK